MDGRLVVDIPAQLLAQCLDAVRHGESLRLEVRVSSVAAMSDTSAVAGPPRGPLAPLMAAGLIGIGDVLVWDRPRKGTRHTAVVLPNGRLEMDGVRYDSPSGAASAGSGNSVDGWYAWKRESDGALLHDLRQRSNTSS